MSCSSCGKNWHFDELEQAKSFEAAHRDGRDTAENKADLKLAAAHAKPLPVAVDRGNGPGED